LTQKQLAKEVVASEALISSCESGKRRPSSDLVEAFAEILGFLPTFFYMPVRDRFTEEECNFRHRRSTPGRMKSQIRAHATLVGMVIQSLGGHFQFPAVNVPQFAAHAEDEVEKAAEHTREYWGVGLDAPIWQMGRVLERAGVVVVRHLVQSTKVDAFSRNGQVAVIFLNNAIESSTRWNFDIGHECGHLVMHRGIQTGDLETEAQADRFASAFLMPRVSFAREFSAVPFSWTHVFDMKRRWHASAAAIIRRAYDLRLITAVKYRQLCQYMSFKGWKKGEPVEPPFQEPELLESALNALGKSVDLSIRDLCKELGFSDETFKMVTGKAVPPIEVRMAEVIQMRLGS
jgi:Zn-dependent peptidase ImmA (M78 family)/transcriptional regulator with XRE-family HTH domain